MANYDDYQLEEMENSAVEKSSMAKRAAAAAGLVGAGAATAYGATRIMGDSHDNVDKEAVTTEDLTQAAQAGVVDEQSMNQTEQATQTAPEPAPEEVHVYHHNVEDKPVVEEEPEMEFQSTTHWYDEHGNQIGQTDEGTYDGKSFAVVDVDNDGHGDYLAYDVNGDGVYQDNEITSIDGYNYAMGHGEEHHDRDIHTGEELVAAHEPTYDVYGTEKENDIADIHNDFEEEKAGEEYGNDLAQYSPDYRNNEDLGNQYSAGMEDTEEYAYEESGKYDDSEIVEEKYELTAEDTENELAYDTTEPSESQEYMMDGTPDVAYDDTESADISDYTQEDSSDLAYDDSQTDDMAQYDIV